MKHRMQTIIIGTWFISCFLFLFYSVFYGGLLIERAFLFALIPFSILVVLFLSLQKKKIIRFIKICILAGMITAIIILPVTKNANYSFEYVPQNVLKTAEHCLSNFNSTIYLTAGMNAPFLYSKHLYLNTQDHTGAVFKPNTKPRPQATPYGYKYLNLNPNNLKNMDVIVILDYFENYYIVHEGIITISDDLNFYEQYIEEEFNRVYDTGGTRVYIRPLFLSF
jgi:hypothetical protein